MAEDSDEAEVTKEEIAGGSSEAAAVDSKAAEQPGEAKPASVDEPAPTLREVFSLPEKEGDPSDDRWQAFQDKVNSEVKKIKWTSTMPDLAPKVCELLNIKIPDVLITAWKKIEEIQAIMEKIKEDSG